jgi:hypothetical protein
MLGWWLIAEAEGGWGATSRLFFAMVCFVGAAILIGAPIARLIAEPTGRLYYPESHTRGTQPLYSIPQSKRTKGLFEEAISGLKAIAKDYPGEVKPYVDMLEIVIFDLKDLERADQIYRTGMTALEKSEDRALLSQKYEAMSALWKPQDPSSGEA